MGAGNGIGAENVIIRDTIRNRAKRLESPETAVQNTSISVNLLEFDDVAYRLQVGNCGEAQVVATVITFGLERLLLQVWAPNVRLRCAFRTDVSEPTKLTFLMALPPQATTVTLPEGALDAVQAQYGSVVKVLPETNSPEQSAERANGHACRCEERHSRDVVEFHLKPSAPNVHTGAPTIRIGAPNIHIGAGGDPHGGVSHSSRDRVGRHPEGHGSGV
eukprot:1188133-Prorocentrum_minimum.AAC.3